MEEVLLTEQRLKAIAKQHFDAEDARNVEAISETVADDVEYLVAEPWYPDDPLVGPRISGRQAVRDLWTGYYEKFDEIKIECNEDEMVAFPERNLVFCHVRITATPNEEFEGFPAGKPFCSQVGAMCAYNDAGEMISETVYGDIGKVLGGLRRMREFLAETNALPIG